MGSREGRERLMKASIRGEADGKSVVQGVIDGK